VKVSEHIDRLAAEGPALADAADRAGLDAPVPTCPEWTVRDLVLHTGNVHRWAALFVTTGRKADLDDAEAADFFAPVPPDEELTGWYRDAHAAIVDALRTAPPDLDCWYFLRAPSPLAFWARRQAHETAIHRVDAQAAASPTEPTETGADFAADGIDELLTCFYARPRSRLRSDDPRSLAVVATDVAAAWTFDIGPDRNTARTGTDDDAHCRLEGRANDLYLALWNRRGFDGLDVRGDRSVLDLWRGTARVRWS
jgi:uncharacterized protein (TIGR03083 family)